MKTPKEHSSSPQYWHFIPHLLFIGVVLGIVHYAHLREQLLAGIETISHSLGPLAPSFFILALAWGVLLFLPVPLFIGIGAIAFGKELGAIYSLIGITIGAAWAFLLGRYVMRDLAKKLIEGRFKKVANWTGTNGFAFMVSLRFIFFSNAFLNYASGSTALTLKDYCLGTLIGILPMTLGFSYLFALVGDAHSFGEILHPFLLYFPAIRVSGLFLLFFLLKREKKLLPRPLLSD